MERNSGCSLTCEEPSYARGDATLTLPSTLCCRGNMRPFLLFLLWTVAATAYCFACAACLLLSRHDRLTAAIAVRARARARVYVYVWACMRMPAPLPSTQGTAQHGRLPALLTTHRCCFLRPCPLLLPQEANRASSHVHEARGGTWRQQAGLQGFVARTLAAFEPVSVFVTVLLVRSPLYLTVRRTGRR